MEIKFSKYTREGNNVSFNVSYNGNMGSLPQQGIGDLILDSISIIEKNFPNFPNDCIKVVTAGDFNHVELERVRKAFGLYGKVNKLIILYEEESL